MRACALNLLVVLPGGGNGADEIVEVVRDVTAAHPARVILITADLAGTPGGVRAWIGARCRRPASDGIQVCHEEIRIAATGDGVEQIDNAALSILIPDLPTLLWWHGPLPERSEDELVFSHLIEQCERLIIDSSRLRHLADDLQVMTCLTDVDAAAAGDRRWAPPEAGSRGSDRLKRCRTAVGDLTWHRLTPWRQLLAQCFDPPQFLPLLTQVSRVTVEYGSDPAEGETPAQVLLLLGWLASRLRWRPDGDRFFHGGEEVKVRIQRTAGSVVGACQVRSITLEMPNTRVIVRRLGEACAENLFQFQGCPPLSRVVPIDPPNMAALLNRELAIWGRNPTYEEALRMAAYLANSWRR